MRASRFVILARRPDTDADGRVADLQRRLHRPSVQHADEGQRQERPASQPRVVLSSQRAGRGPDQGNAADGERRHLSHRPRSRVGHRRAHEPRDLALGEQGCGRHSDRQPRRRHQRRLPLRRDARLQSRVADDQGRQGALAKESLQSRSVLLRVGRADRHRRPRDLRRQRRRSRRARLPRVAQRGDGRARVALVRRAAECRRSGHRDVAESRRGEARRRHDLAARHLRSRSAPALRDDWQPAACRRVRESSRRQPFTASIVALNRTTEDEVVFPVVAARHARLGRNATPVLSTASSTASRGRCSRSVAQLASSTARSRDRQGARVV